MQKWTMVFLSIRYNLHNTSLVFVATDGLGVLRYALLRMRTIYLSSTYCDSLRPEDAYLCLINFTSVTKRFSKGTTTTGSSTTLHTTTTKLRITTVAATGFSLCLILHSSIWPHSITEMICQCRE